MGFYALEHIPYQDLLKRLVANSYKNGTWYLGTIGVKYIVVLNIEMDR